MRFKDKVVLITGASRGIGRATALEFGKEGAKVVVDYIKDIPTAESDALEVVEEIKKFGSEAIAVEADVSDEIQVKFLINQTIKQFERIDILINNAGIALDLPLEERTLKHWTKTLNTNLIGTFLCSKLAIPHLKKGGKIINISSTNGLAVNFIESVDYDASKAGILTLTRALARELAPDIQVNAVAPGWVDTDMNKDLPKDFVQEEIEKTWLKRFADPREIARVILFLSSDDASFINGTTLIVDGGYS